MTHTLHAPPAFDFDKGLAITSEWFKEHYRS